MKHRNLFLALSLGLGLLSAETFAAASADKALQIPDFVYQGRLEQNGTAVNGGRDLSFSLWDAPTGGNQIGSTINEPDYPVVRGVFSINLAFTGAFTGQALRVCGQSVLGA